MNIPDQKISNPIQRHGLSLLELLVVMTILIALGGIVVATLPGILERTQVATAAANVPEIDAAIRRQRMVTQGQIGNRFDSLIGGNSTLDGEIPRYVGGSEMFVTASLSAEEVDALHELGITELVPAATETDNATFDSHDQLPVPLSSDSKVCVISNEAALGILQQNFNHEPTEGAKYAVFGIGEQCTLVGGGSRAAFAESPVHFSDDRVQSPENMYARYLILVEIKPRSESEAVARYLGAGIPGKDGIRSVSRELEEYYSKNSGE